MPTINAEKLWKAVSQKCIVNEILNSLTVSQAINYAKWCMAGRKAVLTFRVFKYDAAIFQSSLIAINEWTKRETERDRQTVLSKLIIFIVKN